MLVHPMVTPKHWICRYPFVLLGGEWHWDSQVSCSRTQRTTSLTRTWTQTTQYGVAHTNHEGTTPHITLQCISCSNKLWMKMYLLKPLWFFHLVNKAQVCFCTGTSGTLKLLETRSYRSDVWKLRRNRMAKTQQIQIDVNNRQLTHPDRLRLCRIQEPNVQSFSPQLEQTHTWGMPLVWHAT